MYKIIYMKADYEPWWQFDGWQEYIVTSDTFDSKADLEAALRKKLDYFRKNYPNEKMKGNQYYAFWTDDERTYCEACEDDLQTYHGLIIENDEA